MKMVINTRTGGFGLSDAAYQQLIEWGVPVQAPTHEAIRSNVRAIFDNQMPRMDDCVRLPVLQRYWDVWFDFDRCNPLLVRVVEELGEKASGFRARLRVEKVIEGWSLIRRRGAEHIEYR
jgi:hypothetical protein